MTNIVRAGQLLASILRHDKPAGIKVDREGWAKVEDIVSFTAQGTPALTLAVIRQVVEENDKKRFALSEDGVLIRALQGHTRKDVHMTFAVRVPPVELFHGTAERNIASIRKSGLVSRERHHVHLSPDVETARKVGQRHDRKGTPVILVVDAKAMLAAGHRFYQSENNVWLTDSVPPQFLK